MESHSGRLRGPTLAHVWTAVAVGLPVLGSLATRLRMVDLAYQWRAGELVLSGAGVPRVDSFTFTVPGQRWVDQQWGAQALLALAHRGGFATDALVRAALIGGIFGLVFLACRARGAGPRSAALLTLGGFAVGLDSLALRPQLIGAAIFAASMWLLAGRHTRPGRVWLLPVLAAAWANVHGSFVLAPLLPALAWAEDAIEAKPRSHRLLAVTLLCGLATFANPWGPAVWTYARDVATDPTIRRLVTEWAPTTPTDWSGALFWLSVVGAAVWLGVRARASGTATLAAIPWLVAFAVIAIPAARGVLWWSLAAPVTLAVLAPHDERLATGDRRVNLGVLGLLSLGAVLLLPFWRSDAALVRDAPADLSAGARALPAGTRLVVPEVWASWFEFDAQTLPVMVDPRVELFPDTVWDDYLEIASGVREASTVLDRLDVGAVVVGRGQSELRALLAADPHWHVQLDEPDGTLFVRRPAGG